jgi:hypothetical protein
MHLHSWYHGSEDATVYKLGEARSTAYWLLSQMAQLQHGYVTCNQNERYVKPISTRTEIIF